MEAQTKAPLLPLPLLRRLFLCLCCFFIKLLTVVCWHCCCCWHDPKRLICGQQQQQPRTAIANWIFAMQNCKETNRNAAPPRCSLLPAPCSMNCSMNNPRPTHWPSQAYKQRKSNPILHSPQSTILYLDPTRDEDEARSLAGALLLQLAT